MLGLPKGEVYLVPWTSEWEEEYLQEKTKIEKLLGSFIYKIHHIGSTAIPHLSAKPIIDIAIELVSFEDGEKCIAALESLHYQFRGTNILPERYDTMSRKWTDKIGISILNLSRYRLLSSQII